MFDKTTYSLLKKLYRCEKMTRNEVYSFIGAKNDLYFNRHISFLLENKMIYKGTEGGSADGAGGFIDGIEVYKIRLRGRAYIEQKRRDLLNFWIPYIITTIVAIAGLLVAIAGLQRPSAPEQNQGTSNPSHTQEQTSDFDASDIQCADS